MKIISVLFTICLIVNGQSKTQLKSALEITKAELDSIKAEKEQLEAEKHKIELDKQKLAETAAIVTKENQSLKDKATVLATKASELAVQKAATEALVKTQQDAVQVQAKTIDNLTTSLPTAVNKEKAVARLMTERHAEDTAAFKISSSMATIAAEKAAAAAKLGEENHKALVESTKQITQHTAIINDIHKSIVSSDRLQVIEACCLVFLIALVVLLFLKVNRAS